MKFEYVGMTTVENKQIDDTDKINAKSLLALFLSAYSPLNSLVEQSDTVKEYAELVEKLCENNIDLYNCMQDIPYCICDCFLRFISLCPHIHITID